MRRHLRSLLDVDAGELSRIIDLAADVKKNPTAYGAKLDGKFIAMMFSKPSTRTRVSFEVGMRQLGAHPLFLSTAGKTGLQVSRGESYADAAKVLSRYVDGIFIRTFAQEQIEALAEHGTIPVVNALSDAYHPCQALADTLTMRERFGDLKGRKLVYVGPGNNVAHSLMLAGPRAGFDVVCACPPPLPPESKVLEQAQASAKEAGTSVVVEHDLNAAVVGAHVIYTDTWVSMGQEGETNELKALLATFMVDEALMAKAADDAIFMHCLPAHRGVEVTDEVMDGAQSVVFDQAENRLHSQKALMLLLLEAEPW